MVNLFLQFALTLFLNDAKSNLTMVKYKLTPFRNHEIKVFFDE